MSSLLATMLALLMIAAGLFFGMSIDAASPPLNANGEGCGLCRRAPGSLA